MFFFFQAEDGIRDYKVTGVQTCALPICNDITQSGTSPGYMVFGEKGNGETEFMHDAAGNGQVNNAGEPVATGCGRSEERRVGKESRCRWAGYRQEKEEESQGQRSKGGTG